MYTIIPAFLTAFLITYFAIPSIIKIAVEKHLVDEPDERRSHDKNIPTLGGLGIFAGLIFSVTYWIPFSSEAYPSHQYIQYILCAFIVIFLIGAKDDIIPISPSKKFLGQIAAALLLVYNAKIQLTSLYGIFWIQDIPEWVGIILSVFTMIVIINALNLIDGINGLSATIGCIVSLTFGAWFYKVGRLDLAILSAALAGSLIAFLRYNVSPAQIFMGDTGSLLIGLTSSILAISFIEMNKSYVNEWTIQSVPAVAVGILIIPLFDTLRVFTRRILKGKSPFYPDKTHIHHLLLDIGCSHSQATIILSVTNIAFIIFVYLLQGLGTLPLLFLTLGLAFLLTLMVEIIRRKKLNL